jgi:zinc transport system permease protein
MVELFSMHFFKNAFIMGFLLSMLFGVLSFFVVMRKMSFLGAGIAHTAFGGVALGILLGINPFYTSLIFCVISAVLIGKLVKYGDISYDASIGIFFSFSMALGAIFIALRKAYSFDLSGYLFGNILGVTDFDKLLAVITVIVFLPFMFIYLHRILFMTFDEEVAVVSGVRTELLDTLLLIFLAGIVVVSIKIVGIILVAALVVLPASFGLLLFKDFRKVLAAGVLYTLVIMNGGLILSYYINTPPGATIVTAGTLIYFFVLLARNISKK